MRVMASHHRLYCRLGHHQTNRHSWSMRKTPRIPKQAMTPTTRMSMAALPPTWILETRKSNSLRRAKDGVIHPVVSRPCFTNAQGKLFHLLFPNAG
jgi:hypothetical protein